jgi:uncharacterized protein (DUF885 family)
MFKILYCSLLTVFLASCSHLNDRAYTLEEIEAETSLLNKFFEEVHEEGLARYPESQTYMGRKTNYDQLNDISDENSEKELKLTKEYLRKLRKFNFDKLTPEAQVSYRLFEDRSVDSINGFKYRYHFFQVNQMFGRHAGLPSFMINMHRIDNLEDAKAYISRLNKFETQLDQLIQNLNTRKKKGMIAPKFVFPKVIDDSLNIISGMPFDKSNRPNDLFQDFEKKITKLNLDSDVYNGLIQEVTDALTGSVYNGYSKLISTFRELEKDAPELATSWTLPDGYNYYKYRLKRITTLDISPEKIHQYGLDDTKRIHNEMMAIAKKVNFQGSLQDFFEFMRTNQKFRYPDTPAGKKQYITDTQKIIDNIKKRLPEMFGILPKADLIIKPVEPFREKSAGLAFYQGPSEDGDRPGIYYINLYDMQAVTKYEQEALAYHEAIPGHHMQISIASELENLPKFRRFGGYTAYSEGWALYSELLPLEFGFYKDPYSDFGRLSMELWRAARLVVDTGLHHKKWSMDQAIKWLDQNTPNTNLENVRAIQRYVVMPGQATAYKVGMKHIQDLRELAERELGDSFDIKAFHDEILRDGSVPMPILTEKIERWIESVKLNQEVAFNPMPEM